MRITRPRRLFISLLAGAGVLWPTLLWAHARLTRSDPAAKAQLATMPSAIRLWFSEAPELALSSITLKDSAGVVVALGPLAADTSKLGLRATIDRALTPGRYTVTWRVAASDGHPLKGSYSFVVLAEAMAADTTRAVVEMPHDSMTMMRDNAAGPGPESIAYVAARFATFLALLAVIGAVVFKFGVVRRLPRLGDDARLVGNLGLARVAIGAAALLLAAAAARLQLQRDLLAVDPSHVVHLRLLAANTEWGRAWLLQVAAAVVFAIAVWIGRRGSTAPWTVAALAAVVLAFTPGLGGHAAASTHSRAIAILADGLHVLGASGWLGGLLCVVLVGFPITALASEGRWQAVASIVNGFSPIALVCAGAVLVTGLLTAWLRLGAIAPLWTTTYGRALLIKLGLLLGVAGTGAYNWLRARPALGTTEATAHLKRSATVELAIGVAVIAATAVLVALPTPMDVAP
jgi:copper transport protein